MQTRILPHLGEVARIPLVSAPRIARELTQRGLHKTPEDFFVHDRVTTDTHIHLGGALHAEAAVRLAYPRSQDLQNRFGSPQAALDYLRRKPSQFSLNHYLDKTYHPFSNPIFADTSLLEDVAFQSALYAYHHGVRKFIPRTSIKYGTVADPDRQYDGQSFTAFDEFEAYMRGFERAEQATQGRLQTSMIICLRRQSEGYDQAIKTLEGVLKLRQRFGENRIVGIDLMGKEFGHKNKAYNPIYAAAKGYGLHLTAHVGEDQDVGPGAILHGLDYLMLDSLGHATSMPTNPFWTYRRNDGRLRNSLIRFIQSGYTKYTEMCLTSNIRCGANYLARWIETPDGKPLQFLYEMDPQAMNYPFDAIMAFGALTMASVRPKVALIATDGIFPTNTNIAVESALAARNFDLGINAILGLDLYGILYSPGAWENTAKDWLANARQYTDKIPPDFVLTKDNLFQLAENLVQETREEALERIRNQHEINMPAEELKKYVTKQVSDLSGYASRGTGNT